MLSLCISPLFNACLAPFALDGSATFELVLLHQQLRNLCSMICRLPGALASGVCALQQLVEHARLMHPPPVAKHLHARAWMVVCWSAIDPMDSGTKSTNDLCQQLPMDPATVVMNATEATADSRQHNLTNMFHSAPSPPERAMVPNRGNKHSNNQPDRS